MPESLVPALRSPADPEPDTHAALQREWLQTDGLGGYACGTAADVPTRRYHAWLCAVPPGGSGRVRFVTGCEERVFAADAEFSLLGAHWRSLAEPSLAALPAVFHPHPVPTWVFGHGEVALERSLVMQSGTRGVFVRWRNVGTLPVRLHVRPLLAAEPADALWRERPVTGRVHHLHHAVSFQPDAGLPAVWLTHDEGGVFREDPCWYRDFFHSVDAARGYDAVGDRWSPGVLELELAPGATCSAAFSVGTPLVDPARGFAAALTARIQRAQWANQSSQPLAARLRHGVDDFFYRDHTGRPGVLAGFPWFGEWGRDAFLSLPGLTLAVGQQERCEEVLRAALPFLARGLLPNVYGSTPAESHYGSADAALWFALAVQRWHDSGQSRAAVRDTFGGALQQIAEAYLAGSLLGLCVDADMLLCAGRPDLNATWMDAQLPSGPVTPRHGQPVEICALWCSLLLHLAELYGGVWQERADSAKAAFVRKFWRSEAQCLFDCVTDGVGDRAIRPNMLVAAALARSPLSMEQRRGVVAVATQSLRTPMGLRTLSPSDPGYCGRYEGSVESRDRAYHQGTVWPWLSGFYVEASLRAAPDARRKQVARELRAWLDGLLPEVDRVGIDHISEVYDGDAPQRPGGTFAQAWNTGELLRALQACAVVEAQP